NNPVFFIDPDGMMPAGFGGQLGLTDISKDFDFGNESGGNNSGGRALGGADSNTENSEKLGMIAVLCFLLNLWTCTGANLVCTHRIDRFSFIPPQSVDLHGS